MSTDGIEPEPRLALKRAVAWRTLTEIARRHPDLPLRLVETHPCGGQYDCLTMIRLPDYAEVCTFNLAGTGLLLGKPFGRRRPGGGFGAAYADDIWRYPQHGLGDDRASLAREIEAWLGFPEGPPASLRSTAAGLSLGVVAELLDRVALGSRPVDVRNGWLDSSGYADVGVRPWARPLVVARGVPADAEWVAQRAVAIRFWALDRQTDAERPRVVVDIATSAVWVAGHTAGALAARYSAGTGIRGLAWWLEQAIDGD